MLFLFLLIFKNNFLILSHVVQFIMLCIHVSLFWSCSVPGTYFQIKNSAIAQFRAYLKVYDRGFYLFIYLFLDWGF